LPASREKIQQTVAKRPKTSPATQSELRARVGRWREKETTHPLVTMTMTERKMEVMASGE